jgi:hypothetical protein
MMEIRLPEGDGSTLDAALGLASAGLRVLMVHGVWFGASRAPTEAAPVATACGCGNPKCPPKDKGKHPVGKGWQTRATSDRAELERWAAEVDSPNVGIELGPQPGGCYLIAIDVDNRDRLKVLEAELGPLPPTVESQSGSGRGEHLFYEAPADVAPARLLNTVGIGGAPGVDSRVRGGQVVVAPSQHQSGGVYVWKRTGPVAVLPIAWALAIAKPPAKPAWTAQYTPQSMRDDTRARKRAEAYLEIAVHSEAHALAACEEGGRNATLYRTAFSLLSLASGLFLPCEFVIRELQSAARACGLSDHEIDKAIASAEEGVTSAGAIRVPKFRDDPKPSAPARKAGAQTNGASNGAAPPVSPKDFAPAPEWSSFQLTTIMTDPPRHELTSPTGGVMRLTTADFLSAATFTSKYLDAFGSLPPLPDKHRAEALRDVLTLLFAARKIITAPVEAGERGTLLEDLRTLLRGAGESDVPSDMVHGALLACTVDGHEVRAFHARLLLDRVRRVCPGQLTAPDYYEALRGIGAEQRSAIRVGTWVGRVWIIAPRKLKEPTEPGEASEATANSTAGMN